MQEIKRKFDLAKRLYDRGDNPLDSIRETSIECLRALSTVSDVDYGVLGEKHYTVLADAGGKSRPFIRELLQDPAEFSAGWTSLLKNVDPKSHRFRSTELEETRTVYYSVMAFALCYDLWKPKSRKTPGT